MAFFPCSVGPHVNRQRNQNFYFALGTGSEFTRWNRRFCSRHAAELDLYLAKFEVLTSDDTVSYAQGVFVCIACGEPVSELDAQLFVTGYPAHDERKDYWAKLHVNCRLPEIMRDTRWDWPGQPGYAA